MNKVPRASQTKRGQDIGGAIPPRYRWLQPRCLVPGHQSQIIVGRKLRGLQADALTQMRGRVGRTSFKIQNRTQCILQLRIALPRLKNRFQQPLAASNCRFPTFAAASMYW